VLGLNDTPVFEPEIEEVAIDQQLRRVTRNVSQEIPESALGGGRHASEVDVRNDVGWLICHGGAKLPVTLHSDNRRIRPNRRLRSRELHLPTLHTP